MEIHWPIGLNEAQFIHDYWQKQPLLIRQAFPCFENPLPPEELAGLACEEGIAARLISHQADRGWQCKHGPFCEHDFAELPDSDWSLLVTDIEKHLPDFIAYLQPFRFIPDWRIDDLMISLAPPGGSVGPHVDQYDVFLLQAEGSRRWSITTNPDALQTTANTNQNSRLKMLDGFIAEQEWVLQPGDMLYLPPGVAHHGVAIDQCMTWSIGFRAPSIRQLVTAWFEHFIDTLPDDERFHDALKSPQTVRGRIDARTLENIDSILQPLLTQAMINAKDWFGASITEAPLVLEGGEEKIQADELVALIQQGAVIERRTDCRFAFIETQNTCLLYVNGESFVSTPELAALLCDGYGYLSMQLVPYISNTHDCELLCCLVNNGALFVTAS